MICLFSVFVNDTFLCHSCLPPFYVRPEVEADDRSWADTASSIEVIRAGSVGDPGGSAKLGVRLSGGEAGARSLSEVGPWEELAALKHDRRYTVVENGGAGVLVEDYLQAAFLPGYC